MAEVIVINPTQSIIKQSALKRVGAYIRVSSDSEDQENSFITQYDHYMNLISVPSQQKWTQKSFKKRNESQYFVNLRKPTAFIPRFA